MHYDCNNCGTSMGIAYGYCDNCTPEIVLTLKQQLEVLIKRSSNEFDESMKTAKEEFINTKTAELRKQYELEYERHKPKR